MGRKPRHSVGKPVERAAILCSWDDGWQACAYRRRGEYLLLKVYSTIPRVGQVSFWIQYNMARKRLNWASTGKARVAVAGWESKAGEVEAACQGVIEHGLHLGLPDKPVGKVAIAAAARLRTRSDHQKRLTSGPEFDKLSEVGIEDLL